MTDRPQLIVVEAIAHERRQLVLEVLRHAGVAVSVAGLTWSSVADDQRMGRVVRISTNFEPVRPDDFVISVLEGALDQRMYDTLKRRIVAPRHRSVPLPFVHGSEWGHIGV